jgi:predicted transcriptional regulator
MIGLPNNASVIGGCVMGTKQQIPKAIKDLPEDASVEDAIDRLSLLYKINKGIRQADQGQLITQDEVRQRMAQWLIR